VFGIEVEFLTGRYVATAHNDRGADEWPPHPARLFSALVATWAEQEDPNPDERDALLLLERAGNPSIRASQAESRVAVTHYVPVNDSAIIDRSLLRDRSTKIEATLVALDAALDATGGDMGDKAVRRELQALAKHRDVTKQVSSLGATSPDSAVALLPDRRGRQARIFPSVTPVEPQVEYIWPGADPEPKLADALDRLLARVVKLGHSSSLVSCRRTGGESKPTWSPSNDGDTVLRCIGSGQLAALESAFSQHRASRPRTLPARGVRYRASGDASRALAEAAPAPQLSGQWFPFEFLPPRHLPIARAGDVTRALRNALMSHAAADIPEGLSGHQPDGTPSVMPHVAFLALPFVGSEHASGRLIGAAVLLPSPSALGPHEPALREAVARAIGAWEEAPEGPALLLGRAGRIQLRRVVGKPDLVTLRRETWERPSTMWSSVTPVALPNHPGDLNKGSDAKRRRACARAEEEVRRSCEHAGLPDPIAVAVGMQPLVRGVSPARAFPVLRHFDRTQQREIARLQVHVALEFARPVMGPLVLGAGRYFGLGLMLPMDGRDSCA